LVQRLIRPVSKPVEYATVEEGRTSGGLGGETILRRVHSEHDVKVLDNLLCEPLVEFFLGVEDSSLFLSAFLDSGHQRGVLVALEQTRNLGVGKESVHAFEETGIENVGFIHDETDLLALATTSPEDIAQVLVEIFTRVFAVDLDLVTLNPFIQATNRDKVVFPEPMTPIRIR
jgi:hypothetical protein